jgi:DNA-binding transcriptional MerR regulator
MPSGKRQSGTYDREFRAKVLLRYHESGNLKGTAREFGVPPSTLRTWSKQQLEKPDLAIEKAKEAFDERLVQDAEEIADTAIRRLKTQLQRESNPKIRDLLAVWTTALDKRAVAQGRPTSINENRNALDRDEIRGVFNEWMEGLQTAAARQQSQKTPAIEAEVIEEKDEDQSV